MTLPYLRSHSARHRPAKKEVFESLRHELERADVFEGMRYCHDNGNSPQDVGNQVTAPSFGEVTLRCCYSLLTLSLPRAHLLRSTSALDLPTLSATLTLTLRSHRASLGATGWPGNHSRCA
jgi:hypothetical protein